MPIIAPFSLCLSVMVGLGAADVDQSLLDLPKAVKSSIQREATGLGVGAIEREVKDGRILYSVRIEQEGIDKRVSIASDGTVLEVSDYAAVNNALTGSKQASKEAWDKTKEVSGQAWDKTKDVAAKTWEATKDTVGKATSAFKSDELTLNQVPVVPRATMEREAAGNRLSSIRVSNDEKGAIYRATISHPDGTNRALAVREDGTLAPSP
jgi:uncharacterized membrane protein YkoI